MSIVVPTFDELYAVGKAEVLARQSTLSDWREGSNLDAMNGAGALLADECIRVLIALFAKQFIDSAVGADLDALATDRFGLTRNGASAAIGTLTFTRGASVGVLTIPGGTQCTGTVNGVTVTVSTDIDTDMGGGDTTVDVLATCTVTGASGNVAAGIIDTILDAIPGDATATVLNAAKFTAGGPEETDAAFRDRIRRYFTTLRLGTVAALEAGARTVPGVSFATVDESFIDPDVGGYVAVYVGDPDGEGNGALATAVTTALDDYRAAGVWVVVSPAAREEIVVTMTVYFKKGIDSTELAAAVRAHVLAYTDALPAGATLFRSALEHAGHAASTSVLSVVVALPVADTAPSVPQNAVRVVTGDLTITCVEVP